MYLLSVSQEFDAAHSLRGYQGKCENLHGHRYRVVARFKAEGLDELGMAADFTGLKESLARVIQTLDHRYLNDLPPFEHINPSAENIAALIFRELEGGFTTSPVKLEGVEVWESPGSGVRYSPYES